MQVFYCYTPVTAQRIQIISFCGSKVKLFLVHNMCYQILPTALVITLLD